MLDLHILPFSFYPTSDIMRDFYQVRFLPSSILRLAPIHMYLVSCSLVSRKRKLVFHFFPFNLFYPLDLTDLPKYKKDTGPGNRSNQWVSHRRRYIHLLHPHYFWSRSQSRQHKLIRKSYLLRYIHLLLSSHPFRSGLCLALGTDIRIAAERAKLGLTFVNLGLHPVCRFILYYTHSII